MVSCKVGLTSLIGKSSPNGTMISLVEDDSTFDVSAIFADDGKTMVGDSISVEMSGIFDCHSIVDGNSTVDCTTGNNVGDCIVDAISVKGVGSSAADSIGDSKVNDISNKDAGAAAGSTTISVEGVITDGVPFDSKSSINGDRNSVVADGSFLTVTVVITDDGKTAVGNSIGVEVSGIVNCCFIVDDNSRVGSTT